jgi:hypothetical protein
VGECLARAAVGMEIESKKDQVSLVFVLLFAANEQPDFFKLNFGTLSHSTLQKHQKSSVARTQ